MSRMTGKNRSVPQVPVPKLNEPIAFRNYIVGFFDILGQREHLAKMGPIPATEDQQKVFEEKAAATLGAIHAFRSLFNAYFASYIQASPPGFVETLPTGEQRRVLESSEVEAGFQGFSDTLIVYMPVMNRHGRYQWRGIHAMLAACATLMPTLLAEGIPVRGALELGVGTEFVKGEIYGPVLQAAYELEKNVAEYPRIVVGEKLRSHIHDHTPNRDVAKTLGVSGEVYDRHMNWLGTDADGISVVDYLGTSARAMIGEFTDDMIRQAYRFVATELTRFQEIGDTKLAERYRKLHQYFRMRCSDLLPGDQ